jgi:2-keto-3-deoxygluconate permease
MNAFADSFKIIVRKIPAGLMVIPLFLGALLHTFCPQVLEIGSFTTATFSNAGAATIMGVQLVCLGSRLELREISTVAKRGGILLLSKLIAGFVAVLIIGRWMGSPDLFGMSLLAIVCAVSNTNGSIYLSLMSLYGDEKDAAAIPIITINNGPFFPILILGSVGMATFSWIAVLAALLPIVIGMVIGNVSKEAKAFLDPGVALLLPFIGFTLGAAIDLRAIWSAGISGVLLSIIALVCGTGISYVFDRFLGRRPGYAAVAAGAVGANAVAVPAIIGLMDRTWQPYVESATIQIAAAVVVTALVIPLLTKYAALRKQKNGTS